MQVPAWQESDWVQASPSVQVLPFGLSGLEQVPLAVSQVPATWHWSRAAQTTGFAPTQAPPWQVSVGVQAFPSVQVLPFGLSGLEQVPLAGSQVPVAWHWSSAAQATGFALLQTAPGPAEVCVLALPSVLVVPFGLSGLEQVPVAGSQVPTSWH